MKSLFLIIAALAVLYVVSYGWIRMTGVERWEQDDRDYVILPQQTTVYYFYRPLMLVDARLTGMRFHVGPHR